MCFLKDYPTSFCIRRRMRLRSRAPHSGQYAEVLATTVLHLAQYWCCDLYRSNSVSFGREAPHLVHVCSRESAVEPQF